MIEETPVTENNGQATQDASIQPAVQQTQSENTKETPFAERLEHAFEAFRSRLVNLIGDIPGVHNVVDDAKEAIKPHIDVTK